MDLKKLLKNAGIQVSKTTLDDFSQWIVAELWNKYKDYRMNLAIIARNEMDATPIRIPNGTRGALYSADPIVFPSERTFDYRFIGLDEIGLKADLQPDESFIISGRPTQVGDFPIEIQYDYRGRLEDEPLLSRRFTITINPDPRSLWKDIPTPTEILYYKPDTDSAYVEVPADPQDGSPRKDIVAASRRGRSHANDGKPRDDDFAVSFIPESDWYVMIVADGAGSAKYSREGSVIACKTTMDICTSALLHPDEIEDAIRKYATATAGGNEEEEKTARNSVGSAIYQILGRAALESHKAIGAAATRDGHVTRDYSTTLLVAIAKKFSFGWFVASYWVGDGAIAIFDKDARTVRLLGTPDEGEYSGQTRFVTMSDIFRTSHDIYSRLRFALVPDFTALMLMSDGVSDPMFETDARLQSPDQWIALWDKLRDGFPDDGIPGVNLADDREKAATELLGWLDFWSKGNHDDRTLAILF